ncbi:MAG: TIGR03435 family protein [Ignavibacteriota bacterium]
MRSSTIGIITAGLFLATGAAFAQTAPKAFEVASIKPAAPIDMMKMAQQMQNGEAPKIGMHVNPGRVEFIYVDLKTLVSIAYKLKPYQVTGPDWMSNQRYDIMATFPAGATRADIPQMLQALLRDRLKLEAHLENKEHPVFALVVAKGGPKLKESEEGVPSAIDENAPLKTGEMESDTPDGPVRTTIDMKTGSGSVNMGAKGTMKFSMDRPAQGAPPDFSALAFHIEGKQMTMAGFVEMLAQFANQLGGGTGRQIVDMTGLKGHYEVSLAIPFSDLIAIARAQGMDVPGMPNTPGAGGASDPAGSNSMFTSVQALGLKLESRKAPVDQVVVDRAEKVPTEN